MGRKRRKTIRVLRRKIPKIYSCPRCGIKAVHFTSKNRFLSLVKCGSCGVKAEIAIKSKDQHIDVYCKFADRYYAGFL